MRQDGIFFFAISAMDALIIKKTQKFVFSFFDK